MTRKYKEFDPDHIFFPDGSVIEKIKYQTATSGKLFIKERKYTHEEWEAKHGNIIKEKSKEIKKKKPIILIILKVFWEWVTGKLN